MEGFKQVWSDMPILLDGLLLTIEMAALSLFFATIIGLVFGLFRVSNSKILVGIVKLYVSFVRGIPLYVLLIFFYFGIIPMVVGSAVSPFVVGVLVLSINAGAYLVEIFRAGIESIDKGQTEAGRALGFTKWQTMRYIVLPQAVKRMIPTFLNQFIISLKDTSLLATIGIMELTFTAQTIYSMNFLAFEYLATIGLMYWVLIIILSYFSSKLERRLSA